MSDTSGTYTYNPNPQAAVQKPNPNNGTVPGGINTMIQALMAGNDAYKKEQAQKAAQGAQPLAQAPGTTPASMSGGLSSPSGTTSMPQDASPVTMDPATNAMMGGSGIAAMEGAGIPMGGFASMLPSGTGGLASMLGSGQGTNDPVTQALFSSIPGM